MYYSKLTDLGIKLTRHSGQEKTLCPQCSDGRKNKRDKCLSVHITNGSYSCHNCGWQGNVRSFERKRESRAYDKPDPNYLKAAILKEKTELYFARDRKISKKTLDKFMIFSKDEYMPQTGKSENCICFPYFKEDVLINYKLRTAFKAFRMSTGAELIFYNLNSMVGKKKVIICEGEIDAMSCYEAGFWQDIEPLSQFGIVSVPNGASSGNQKLDYLDNCSDWFLDMEEIIIATDGDEAGRGLKDELIRRLGVERCRYVVYPEQSTVDASGGVKRPPKDLNEVLIHFGKEAVVEAVMTSQAMPIDGIYYVEDIFGSMLDNFEKGIQLAPTTRYPLLDQYFRWKKGDISLWSGYGNAGKALALDTKLPTPEGWTTMGMVQAGDKLFDENGQVCTVLDATDEMYGRECYEVEFSDGTKIIADKEHLWLTHTVASRLSEKNNQRIWSGRTELKPKGTDQSHKRVMPKVRTTGEIKDDLFETTRKGEKYRHYKHSIDLCKPIKGEEKNLPIHPYILGVWLGDGTTADGGLTCNDPEIVEYINHYGFKTSKRAAKYSYGILGLKVELAKIEVLGNKRIPYDYLRSSVSQRLDLLKGLMDTDGFIDKNSGVCEFTTIKRQLADQVYELICSLGIKATIKIGDAKINGRFISKKYRICFKPRVCVFNLKRKAIRHIPTSKNTWRYIKNIKKVDSVPVRCIMVDSPNKLYLCSESFIPTHNTTFVIQMMLTKSLYDGWKWGVFCPENYPAHDFFDDMVEMYAGKWLSDMNKVEYMEACEFINNHIFYVYPDDEHDIAAIHDKFRYLILKKGVDGVLIDPWNQLDHNQTGYQREDIYLSTALKDIKRFALLNNISYNIITHPKNPKYEEGRILPVVDMYDLHGGSMWGNKADQIVIYHRPRFHEDKNSPEVEIHFQKVKRKRTGGQLGHIEMSLDWKKKRYAEADGEIYCDPLRAARFKTGQEDLPKRLEDKGFKNFYETEKQEFEGF